MSPQFAEQSRMRRSQKKRPALDYYHFATSGPFFPAAFLMACPRSGLEPLHWRQLWSLLGTTVQKTVSKIQPAV